MLHCSDGTWKGASSLAPETPSSVAKPCASAKWKGSSGRGDRRQPRPQAREKAVTEPIVITIAHKLGKEEALRRIRPALAKACETFPLLKAEQETWSDDRMDFRVRALGQLVAGNLTVGEDTVRLEVTLPWLLHKFATAVQKTVNSRGRILLEKK